MSLPASVPVKVNFNVVIDADSKVQLFGEVAPAPTNVIVAEHTLPVTALYDADAGKGLLEIWEPADAQGDIKCQLANSDTSASGGPVLTGAYQTAAKKLAAGLQAILCNRFDCSGAAPYTNYTTNVEYFKQRDFGRVALGMMAHYLFGHVDATAAITNDKAFVESMLSISAGGDDETADGPAARVAAFIKSITANVEAWNFAASAADANLALRLVEAVIKKGKAGGVVTSPTLVQSSVAAVTDTMTDLTLANIVKQVIGQDSSRVQNVDGSQRTRDQHLLLRFYPGDVIYMNIKVKRPTVEVTGVPGGANAPAASLVTEQNYVLKITLSRAVSGYTPTAISNMLLWLDASDPESYAVSGSTLTAISDKSGRANNATSIVGSPVVSPAAINGKAAIQLNGSTTAIVGPLVATGPMTAIAVTTLSANVATPNPDAGGGKRLLAVGRMGENDRSTTTAAFIMQANKSIYMIKANEGGQGAVLSQSAIPSYDTPFIVAMTYNNFSTTNAINGGDPVWDGNTGGVLSTQVYSVGRATGGDAYPACWEGKLGEMLIFNKALTTQERQTVEGYLAHKWGLQAQLPANHPYKTVKPEAP